MKLTNAQYACKAAVRRAIEKAGGCRAAAEVTRVDAGRLSKYGSNDHPEFAPIDVCLELDQAAGDSGILRAMADYCGFDLVKRESVDDQVTKDVAHLAGNIARETGALVSDTLDASADGKFTPREAAATTQQIGEVRDNLILLEDRVRESQTAARA